MLEQGMPSVRKVKPMVTIRPGSDQANGRELAQLVLNRMKRKPAHVH
jgi:hypothetical protein